MQIIKFPAPDVPVLACRLAVMEGRRDAEALWIYAQYLDAVLAEMLVGEARLVRQVQKLAAKIERESGHLPVFRACVVGSGALQDLREARLDRLAGLPVEHETAPYVYGKLRTVPLVGRQQAAPKPLLQLAAVTEI